MRERGRTFTSGASTVLDNYLLNEWVVEQIFRERL